MPSPFVFDVSHLLRSGAAPESFVQRGEAPERVGVEMIAIEKGTEVTVDATLSPLGDAVMIDATVQAPLTAQCSRCLAPLHPLGEFHINEVFAAAEDFIGGEDAADDEEEMPQVTEGRIDITQQVIDAAGLTLPFNPTCEELGPGQCDGTDVPEPDGISGKDEKSLPDPRWAGLEKFK